MSQLETSYFTLRPCDKQIGTTDPKPESQKHTSDANYLHGLDVPSLPPLSHLLTSEDNNNDMTAAGPTAHQGTTTTTTTTSVESSPVSAATSTSPTFSVAQALMDQEQHEKQLFTSAAQSLSMTSSTAAAISAMTDSLGIMAPNAMHQTPVTTAPLNMLTDPNSAAAAAAAAAMYLTPSQNDNTNTNTSTSAAAAAATAAAAASLLASNPMLPPTTGHPSSFYNSPTSTKDNDPNFNNSNAGLVSLMLPPNNNPQETIEKNYSFVSIPGANQRKRPRRRYDEIERLYHCTWPGCTKSYGTLNHLNAHVSMQNHGEKRHPAEFKEMRRNWRRQKKEREVAKKAAEKECLNSTGMANTTMATGPAPALGPMMTSLQPYNSYAPFPMYTSLPQNMASIGTFY